MIDYKSIFDALPGNYLVINIDAPKFTMLHANSSHLSTLGMKLEDLQNKPIFDVFPDVSGNLKTVKSCLDEVVASNKPCKPGLIRYDIPSTKAPNEFITKYWNLEYTPILDSDNNLICIVQTSLDITSLVNLGLHVEK